MCVSGGKAFWAEKAASTKDLRRGVPGEWRATE